MKPRVEYHYLPHHAMLKECATTPLRIVFNGNVITGPNSISLNQDLEAGPSLSEKLMDGLFNFRVGRYGILVDVYKVHRCTGLQLKDHGCQIFLERQPHV